MKFIIYCHFIILIITCTYVIGSRPRETISENEIYFDRSVESDPDHQKTLTREALKDFLGLIFSRRKVKKCMKDLSPKQIRKVFGVFTRIASTGKYTRRDRKVIRKHGCTRFNLREKLSQERIKEMIYDEGAQMILNAMRR